MLVQKDFGSKNFESKNDLVLEDLLGPKKNVGPKNFGSEIILYKKKLVQIFVS